MSGAGKNNETKTPEDGGSSEVTGSDGEANEQNVSEDIQENSPHDGKFESSHDNKYDEEAEIEYESECSMSNDEGRDEEDQVNVNHIPKMWHY